MAGFDPNQPRNEEGEWAGAETGARIGSGLSYRVDQGVVSKVKGGTELPSSLEKRLKSLESPVRVIYNAESNEWHISNEDMMGMQHGEFVVEALDGYTPEFTEQIQARGVFDIASGELLMYDFSDEAEFIAGVGNEKKAQYAFKRVSRKASSYLFYFKNANNRIAKPKIHWELFGDVAGG